MQNSEDSVGAAQHAPAPTMLQKHNDLQRYREPPEPGEASRSRDKAVARLIYVVSG